ncbi:hypothetical protein NMU42_10450, partial [Pasteurella multocida]|nr:hypothetical protein [Pasteurella multocida]
ATLVEQYFHQDPTQAQVRHAIFKLSFTHPVDRQKFENDEKSKASVDELKKLKSNLDSRVSKLQKQFGALKDDAV